MKYLFMNSRKYFVFVALSACIFLFAAQYSAVAQGTQRKFMPGDKIERAEALFIKSSNYS